MSTWATRCNACGTAFRVQAEQLEVSDGYVRCGRCDAVFNARATLFDLDAPEASTFSSPASLSPPGHGSLPFEPSAGPSEALRPPPDPAHGAADLIEPGLPDASPAAAPDSLARTPLAQETPIDTPSTEPHWVEPTGIDRARHPGREEPTWSAVHAEVGPETDDPAEANARMLALLRSPSAEDSLAATPTAPPSPTAPSGLSTPTTEWPSLQRAAAPRLSRRGQWVGTLLALTLGVALPLQWAWIERDALRARSPALDQLLKERWPTLGARGWEQLEGLSVVSSTLKATPQDGAYQLELVLRNGSPHRLAMPWLDLSLADAKGAPLVRKALAPSALGAAEPMAPEEQRRLTAIFKVPGSAVAGYEIGLFHP